MSAPPRGRTPLDFAQTDRARHDREIKARALAAAAVRLGVPDDALSIEGPDRVRVRREAGVRQASDETWSVVHFLLSERDQQQPPASAPIPDPGVRVPESTGARSCTVPGCGAPGRLYLGGWRCDPHAPWAVDGGLEPAPPPGTTLAELRAARGIAPGAFAPPPATVVDDRAVASGKRRSTTALYQVVRAREAARRRGGRAPAADEQGGR